MIDRTKLKDACKRVLSRRATEHTLGHQSSKAFRYYLQTKRLGKLEVMFEGNPESPANLWLGAQVRSFVEPVTDAIKSSPGAGCYTKPGKTGKLLYGRHSGLEKMPQLGLSDLICICIEDEAELETILERLKNA